MSIEQGVLWDLDGVLVDTGELHFQAWSDILAEYNIPFSHELFRVTFGMNNAGVLATLLGDTPPPELLAEISARKEERFRQAIRGCVRLLPGARDWLARLKTAGVRQAIASSAPPENMDVMVDEPRLRSYFDAIVSGYNLSGKPAPDVFLEAARQIGVLPARCVVVEDSVAGVEAARRAGMKCIAVTTSNPAPALAAADIVVERLDALPADTFRRLLST